MKAIYTRRSVRRFDDRAIEAETIDHLLRSAMQAPSAGNQQPWEFLVVRGKDNLSKLSEYNPYAGCLKNAQGAIVVLGNKSRMVFSEHWEQDLGAASQNILLEAVDQGLGAVWLGTAPSPDRMSFIQKLYDLDKDLMPYAVIAIGHPADPSANHYVDRYDPSRVHYID